MDPAEVFTEHSSDGEGLTRQQTYMALVMADKNPTGAEIASFFQECEIEDPEGTITLSQFEDLLSRPSIDTPTVEGLTEAFSKFDKNGDGTIDREELTSILSKVQDTTGIETELDDATVDDIWNAVDTDGSGTLSYEELAQYVVSNGSLA